MENAADCLDCVLSTHRRDDEIFPPYMSFDTVAHAVHTDGERHCAFLSARGRTGCSPSYQGAGWMIRS
jgi:hypothetical protein